MAFLSDMRADEKSCCANCTCPKAAQGSGIVFGVVHGLLQVAESERDFSVVAMDLGEIVMSGGAVRIALKHALELGLPPPADVRYSSAPHPALSATTRHFRQDQGPP